MQLKEIDKDKLGQSFAFEIMSCVDNGYIKACKTDTDGRVVETKHKMYRMAAESKPDMDAWTTSIVWACSDLVNHFCSAAIRHSPLYDALQLQKQRMAPARKQH